MMRIGVAEGMKMKINSKDFRARPGTKVKLKEWPTRVKPFCKSKKRYQKLLEEHVEELSSLQRLHYASNRYALLLIFQAMDEAHLRRHPVRRDHLAEGQGRHA